MARNDEYGWKRGCGAYSQPDIKLAAPKSMPPVHSVAGKLSDGPSAALPRGGPPRYKVKSAGFDGKPNGANRVKAG